MAQITWKNIDAPSFRDAILANNSASQLIGGALDSLTQVANIFDSWDPRPQ